MGSSAGPKAGLDFLQKCEISCSWHHSNNSAVMRPEALGSLNRLSYCGSISNAQCTTLIGQPPQLTTPHPVIIPGLQQRSEHVLTTDTHRRAPYSNRFGSGLQLTACENFSTVVRPQAESAKMHLLGDARTEKTGVEQLVCMQRETAAAHN
jgi:hypothetical protein